MSSILKWIVGVGIAWFVVTLGATGYLAWIERNPTEGAATSQNSNAAEAVVNALIHDLLDWGAALGHFIAPVVQIALVVMILIAAAERFGFTQEKRLWSGFAALGTANNVQAFIAVAIVGGLVFGMLGRLLDTSAQSDLKDLALVVVGFYFGTRRRQGEVEDAVAGAKANATTDQSPSVSDIRPADNDQTRPPA